MNLVGFLLGCLWGMILVVICDRQPYHYQQKAIVRLSANSREVK